VTLKLSAGVLAQHVIALGKTGAGKSSALRVLVEGLLEADKPVCIIDPKGDWWGIKSSADGKKAGFPVVVFGGEHADVPINEHSGAAVAELIATGNRSALIDLGGWMVGERTRFFIAFASTLFKLTRGARHLVIDEVHNFAPQGKILDPDAGKMLHWANRLASEGRGKGITIIAASQRPQKVHKDFVTSCETLIAMRVIHKLDRDSIKDWIDGCADPAKGREVLATLAQMKRGEAWIWSPEIEYGPERIAFPMFKTYDSFKPQSADVTKLAGWAEVDLDAVKTKLAAVLEEVKGNDPRELKKQIADLQRQLKAAPAATDIDPQQWKADIVQSHKEGFTEGQRSIIDQLEVYYGSLEHWHGAMPRPPVFKTDAPVKYTVHPPGPKAPATERAIREVVRTAASQVKVNGNATLSKAERLVLTALAQYPNGRSKTQVAILAGYAHTGGGFNNALGSLRSQGFIDGDASRLAITAAGLKGLGSFDELPRGPDLLQHWMRQLSKAERKALECLAEAYPHTLTKQALANRAGYEADGGGFNNALGKLRSLELISGRGEIRASEDLF
jgi:hypothetical protein